KRDAMGPALMLGGGGDAGGGILFLLEQGVETLAEGRAGLGAGQRVERGEGLGERGILALAIQAGGKMGANLGGVRVHDAGVEEVRKTFLGLGAVHGRFSFWSWK